MFVLLTYHISKQAPTEVLMSGQICVLVSRYGVKGLVFIYTGKLPNFRVHGTQCTVVCWFTHYQVCLQLSVRMWLCMTPSEALLVRE